MFQKMISRAIALGGLTVAKVNSQTVEVRFYEGYQVARTGISFTNMADGKRELEKLANELQEGDSWYIGLWHDGVNLFIEPSYLVLDKKQALELGGYYKQQSIYDWENDDFINLRYCDVTDEYITEGFYDENTGKYFKDEEALLKRYTQEEVNERLEDESLYWTQWED
jgi:hypothetical protein